MTDQYGTVLIRVTRYGTEVVNVEPLDDTKLHFTSMVAGAITNVDTAEFDSAEDRDAAYGDVVATFTDAGYEEAKQ